MKWFNFLTQQSAQTKPADPPFHLKEVEGFWYITDRHTGAAVARLNDVPGTNPKLTGEMLVTAANSRYELIEAVRLALKLARIDQDEAYKFQSDTFDIDITETAIRKYCNALESAGVKP